MNATRKILSAVVLLVFASSAWTQQGPKLYRWIGPDGKPHYSDDLPPEALNQARQELSKSGVTLKQVDRAQTTEERTAAQAKADADEKAAEAIQKATQNDQVLLSSYPTEADLKRAYHERIDLQNETLKVTRMGMEGQHKGLSGLLIAASNLELAGKPINAQLAKNIQVAHAQLIDQQQQEVQQKAQAESLRQESEALLTRYRSLRAAGAPGQAPNAPSQAVPPNG